MLRAVSRLLVPAVLLLGACTAGTGRSRQITGDEIFVEVQNNLTPPREVTVRLIASTGQRALLGSLSPGQTRTFRYREPSFTGSYRLLAEVGTGADVSSTAFSVQANEKVIWQLRSNLVRVIDPE